MIKVLQTGLINKSILNFRIFDSQFVDVGHEKLIGFERNIWKDEYRRNQFIERIVPFVKALPIDLKLNDDLNGLSGFQPIQLDEGA